MTEKDWIIQYDKKEVGKRSYGQESLMSLGNGYLGLRGAPLWSTCSDNHYPGLYVAGALITQVQKSQDMMSLMKIW
ncbi:Trehalose 6-phosphate phosphorylase [Lactococcus lactis]|nr:Trehalose 6-phosphate phosphorylase [Lactococcus lactis]